MLEITIKHLQTEMGLFFRFRLWVLLFLLVAIFLINFLFFCFGYIWLYEPDMFRQIIFPVVF